MSFLDRDDIDKMSHQVVNLFTGRGHWVIGVLTILWGIGLLIALVSGIANWWA